MLKAAKQEGCITVALTRFGQDEATRLANYITLFLAMSNIHNWGDHTASIANGRF